MFFAPLGLILLALASFLTYGMIEHLKEQEEFSLNDLRTRLLFIIVFYGAGICCMIVWRIDRRNKLLLKLNTASFSKGDRTLSWFQRIILGRRVVAKIQSGQYFPERTQRDIQTENALKELENSPGSDTYIS